MGAQQSSQFPYDVGEPISGYTGTIWSLYRGLNTNDRTEVSIFKFEKSNANPAQLELAENAFKQMKKLRHPGIVKLLGAVEIGTVIYAVTEPVVPFTNMLSELMEFPDFLALGLHQIATVVNWLNMNGLVHGQLFANSLFCTKSGEWKLFGFELLSEPSNPNSTLKKHFYSTVDQNYQPPEVQKKSWNGVEKSIHSLDSWMIACLIFELFNGPFSEVSEIQHIKQIPKNLAPRYKKLLASSPSSRISCAELLQSEYFSKPLIDAATFIDTMAIKDPDEKDVFFKKLDSIVESFPRNYCKYKILPALVNALDYGSANARVISPLLKIGTFLSAEEYSQYVTPSVVKWFQNPDRQLRMNLLQNLGSFAQHLQGSLIDTEIYPHVSLGFQDSTPALREMTVRSMIHLVPKMSASIVDSDVVSKLARMQLDPEANIRTNTTICVGLLAPHLPEKTRDRILLPAFSRALADPFFQARIAGIKAFISCHSYFSIEQIATKIIPVVSNAAIDPDRQVREAAISILKDLICHLEKLSFHPTDPSSRADQQPSSISSSSSSSSSADPSGSSAGKVLGWAFSSITSKIYSSSSTDNHPTPSVIKDAQIRTQKEGESLQITTENKTSLKIECSQPISSQKKPNSAKLESVTKTFTEKESFDDWEDDDDLNVKRTKGIQKKKRDHKEEEEESQQEATDGNWESWDDEPQPVPNSSVSSSRSLVSSTWESDEWDQSEFSSKKPDKNEASVLLSRKEPIPSSASQSEKRHISNQKGSIGELKKGSISQLSSQPSLWGGDFDEDFDIPADDPKTQTNSSKIITSSKDSPPEKKLVVSKAVSKKPTKIPVIAVKVEKNSDWDSDWGSFDDSKESNLSNNTDGWS